MIITYDITSKRSFDSLAVWLQQVKDFADPKIVTILIGNKCDLSHLRTVPKEEAQKFAGMSLSEGTIKIDVVLAQLTYMCMVLNFYSSGKACIQLDS